MAWRERATQLKHVGERLGERVSRSLPGKAAQRFSDASVPANSAALAFYSLLSLAPLVVLLLWITAALYPDAQEEFFRQVGLLVGQQVESVTRTIVRNAESEPELGSIAGLIGIGTLLFGASIVFGQLQTTLNLVFRCPHDGTRNGIMAWLRKRLIGFGIVLSLGFLLLISMAAQALLALLARQVPDLLPVFVLAFSAAMYALAFGAMYKLLPDRHVSWRICLIGGLVTAVLFMIGRTLIGIYLGQAAPGSAYGPAGGLVVMLVWMYYSSLVFFAGAVFTAIFDEHVKGRAADELRVAPPEREIAPHAGDAA